MKSFNSFGVYWKIQFLGGVSWKTNIEGEGLGQFADLRAGGVGVGGGGLATKTGVVFLWRGGWYPNADDAVYQLLYGRCKILCVF